MRVSELQSVLKYPWISEDNPWFVIMTVITRLCRDTTVFAILALATESRLLLLAIPKHFPRLDR